VLAAAAGAAGVAALFFFSLGGFLWLQQTYGTINASLVIGGAYALLAVIASVAVLVSQGRRTAAPRAAAAATATPQWWADPVLLTTGIEVVRLLGRRSVLPLAIAAVLAGFVFSSSAAKRQKPSPPGAKPNGRGTFEDARN
jgi:hypothetical protein